MIRLTPNFPSPVSQLYNEGCLTCGSSHWSEEARPTAEQAIDLGVRDSIEGPMYLCTRCATFIARLIGYVSKAEAQVILGEAELVREEGFAQFRAAQDEVMSVKADREVVERLVGQLTLRDEEKAKAKPQTKSKPKPNASV